MVTHEQLWVTAGPRWGTLLAASPMDKAAFARPEILRLEGDQFMPELSATLALPEAERAAALADRWLPTGAPKLFQPAHGHFTVVMASLVCRLPGLPEHVARKGERVGFVFRRRLGGTEHAWVEEKGSNKGRWVALANAKQRYVGAAEEETVLGLFPMRWADGARTRTGWAGVVPTGAREHYEGATVSTSVPAGGSPLMWSTEIEARVIGPADALFTQNGDPDPARHPSNSVAQEVTRWSLLDLADILVGACGPTILGTNAPAVGASIWWTLQVAMPVTGGGSSGTLRAALAAAQSHRAELLATGTWPGAPSWNWLGWNETTWEIALLIFRNAMENAGLPDAETATDLPSVATGSAPYVVRCVYQRTSCGLPQADVISDPSLPFRLAPFLDLDAPQRETRITLPTDPSLAGLRKLKKSVGIVMSAAMRSKTETASSQDVLDGEKPPDKSFGVGWITIWSIPILTLCATILLMIIATLLNLVFWWLPLLRITIPVQVGEDPE